MGAGRAARDVDAALVLYARVPRAGEVKTRLIPWLGAGGALRLHLALLEDSLRLLRVGARDAGATPFLAFSDPWEPGAQPEFAALAAVAAGLPRRPQRGGDLGERLTRTIRDLTREGYRRVAVLGSDSPTLPASVLPAAFAALRGEADVVLGPTDDGGYYLVGSPRPVPPIFAGIPWSTPRVLDATLDAARRAAARVVLLQRWYDIDTPADLERLCAEPAAEGPALPAGGRSRTLARRLIRTGRVPRRSTRPSFPAPGGG